MIEPKKVVKDMLSALKRTVIFGSGSHSDYSESCGQIKVVIKLKIPFDIRMPSKILLWYLDLGFLLNDEHRTNYF